ncbi:hypothetical protein N7462_006974 [Penicillium macrosclerotiorum]|uniref:uncharacterized protein n=1 Tax=Penicillium macrosclerotiorum TaxID=303699 RepID=UPI00254979A0|nr:uncharacterized protein N7462_006974 [Penicillium macrosclerotiorum]KAJ5678730.1 hypothetical protein N7462_006974 [Penicillium macrosclerotiorum]
MPGSCEVCSSEPSKYRCPTCALMSCSLACSQSHKIYCAPKPTPLNEDPAQPPAADAGHPSQLQNGDASPAPTGNPDSKRSQEPPIAAVATSSELQALFTRYPQLRGQLQEMYQATQEEEWQEWYTPPTRGRPHGRGGKGPSRRSRGPWTTEKGFNRGLGKVRKLRQDCEEGSETGVGAEAFMAFLALVNQDHLAPGVSG